MIAFPNLDLISYVAAFASTMLGESFGAVVGGGGFVIQPALVQIGYVMPQAIALCVAASAVTATTGLSTFASAGRVPWSLMPPIVFAAISGSLLGSLVASQLSPQILAIAFVAAAAGCLLLSFQRPVTRGQPSLLRHVIIALLIAAYAAMLSAGSGVISVILFKRFTGATEGESIVLRKLVLVPAMVMATIAYSASGVMDFRMLPAVAAGALAAGIIGAHIVMRTSDKTLMILFRAAILVLAAFSVSKFAVS